MKNQKRFIIPEVEIIRFYNDDIILTSGEGDIGEINHPWWGGDNPGFPGNPVNH